MAFNIRVTSKRYTADADATLEQQREELRATRINKGDVIKTLNDRRRYIVAEAGMKALRVYVEGGSPTNLMLVMRRDAIKDV